jgi:transposase-like protein
MSKPIVSAMAKWRGIIKQHAGSGLPVKQFCRRNGVAESSFFAWKRRLRSGAIRPTFIEAKVAGGLAANANAAGDPSSASVAGVIDVRLRGGRVVRVRRGFDSQLLAELVCTLEGLA